MRKYGIVFWLVIVAVLLTGCRSEKKLLNIKQVSPTLIEMDLNETPTHEQLSAAGQLGGVLVPTKPVMDKVRPSSFDVFSHFSDDEKERKLFGQAIQNWNKHSYSDAVNKFDNFRQKFPHSAWTSEATLHMACNARFTGQYTTANILFNEIIEQNKDSDYIGARLMTAKAKSRLAVLRLMENNSEQAKNLFSQVYSDSPDWRLKVYASNWLRKLSVRKDSAGSLLDCGTRALSYLLEKDGFYEDAESVLGYIPDNENGFSISELILLANEYKYKAHAIKATVNELMKLQEPAILQISRSSTGGKGHYWVLENIENGQFNIFDPQMNRRFQFNAEQIKKEWGGNVILLSKTGSNAIGELMSEEEMTSTYGGCCGIQRPQGDTGFPESIPDSPESDCSKGAPIWTVNMVNMNLFMTDIPLWYNNEIGPNVEIKLSYNSQSVLAQNEPFGNKWMFNYGTYLVVDPGEAVTIFGSDGREDVFIKDAQGKYQSDSYYRTKLVQENQDTYSLIYADGSKKIYGVPKNTKALQYFLLEKIDAYGNKLIFHYNNEAKMVSIEDSHNRMTHLNYDAVGLISSVDDPFGRKATFLYDENRNLISLVDMEGYTASLTYDDNRFVTSLGDAKGTTKFYIEPADGIRNGAVAYNSPGSDMWENYRITVTLPNKKKEEYYFNGFNKSSWYVNADNYRDFYSENNNYSSKIKKTVYKFVVPNGRIGKISEVKHPDGSSNKIEYYKNNKIKSIKDQFGKNQEFKWNENGLLIERIDKLGNTIIYDYADNNIDLISISTVNGVIKIEYDDYHKVVSISDYNGDISKVIYNENGNEIRKINEEGIVTNFIRNEFDFIKEIIHSGKTIKKYTYDSMGRIEKYKDINNYTYLYEYNNIDTLLKVTYPSGRVIKKVYGTCPRMLTKKIRQKDRVYEYRYNDSKQLTKIINPILGRVELTRSSSGLITSILDENSNRTKFDYTYIGKLNKKTYSDGTNVNIEYDKDGLLTKKVNAREIIKEFIYNDKQQITRVDYSDDTPSVNYQYDEQGRVILITDQFGNTKFEYYPNGQLKTKDGPLDNDLIYITYNKVKKISSVTINNTINSSYEYDDLGRLLTINAFSKDFNYSYSNASLSPSIMLDYPSGVQQSWQWDKQSDLAQLRYTKKDTSIAEYNYKFDESGQLSEQIGTSTWRMDVPKFTASYNDLNQIIEWNGDKNIFEYDKDGNPTKGILGDGTSFAAIYDAENRLVELSFIREDIKYKETFGYAYNNMLSEYKLYQNEVLAKTKHYVRLGLVELQEQDGKGKVEQEYAWNLYAKGGIGNLLITKTADKFYQYIYSHTGNVQKVIDGSGNIVANYQYTPYGQASGDAFTLQPFGYSTKRSDFESGLVYFGYRFYAPHLGRWLNRDPLQEEGGINLYAYVNGDPLGYVDPDGREPWDSLPVEAYMPDNTKLYVEQSIKKAEHEAKCEMKEQIYKFNNSASILAKFTSIKHGEAVCSAISMGLDIFSEVEQCD
ncbi:RHS repeat-associated core domain-containing protein [Aliivibrio salmonicida]|uniref:RHS repeat-associated core domain-containing protein n=2 Tax=Aliivibrio salmonicida TaxID=40269 RepID=UPI0030B7B72B